jgi:alkylated DNA nucleotide flippase Atl1
MAATLMKGDEIDPRAPRLVDQVVATNHDHLWHRVVLREARVPREAELPG